MKQYNSWHSYKRLLRFIVPYKKKLSIAVVCMAFSGLSNVVVPWVIKDVIDKVLAQKDVHTLNLICVGILALFIFRGFFYFWQKYLMSYIDNILLTIFVRLFIAIFRRCLCLILTGARPVIL
jgi:subfamily B ATP-binding cassette protein MsbA